MNKSVVRFYSTNDRGDNVPFSSSVCLLARHGVVEVGQSEAILVFRTRLSTCKQIVLLVEPEPQRSFTLEVICHLPEVVPHPANLLGIGRFCTGRGNSAGSPRPPYVSKGSAGGFPRSRMSLKIGHVTTSRYEGLGVGRLPARIPLCRLTLKVRTRCQKRCQSGFRTWRQTCDFNRNSRVLRL